MPETISSKPFSKPFPYRLVLIHPQVLEISLLNEGSKSLYRMAGDLWASELLCKCSINSTFNCKLIRIANETPVIYRSECLLQTGINAICWPWAQSRIPELSWRLRRHRSGLELRGCISSHLCCPFTVSQNMKKINMGQISTLWVLLDSPVPHTACFLAEELI